MSENSQNIERQESPPEKPLFLVTLMRHARPFYKDEGHDLTPEGVEQAKTAGRRLKESGYFEDSDVFLIHSPTARAKGTLEFVADAAGLADAERRATKQLRHSDFRDNKAFMNSVNELAIAEGIDVAEASTKHHYVHPMHEEDIVVEKHSSKKARLYRVLEYIARWFDQHPYMGTNTPHILAMSHFEIITHLVADVFGMPYERDDGTSRYNVPSFAEHIRIAAYPSVSKEKLRLSVTYDGKTKDVLFDRKTRSIAVEDSDT